MNSQDPIPTGNTTHTVQWAYPSPLSSVPTNKAAQFILGCVILLVAWKMYWAGWFSQTAAMSMGLGSDGFNFAFGGLIPFVVDAVCLVGIAGFTITKLMWDMIAPLIVGSAAYVSEMRARGSARLAGQRTAQTRGDAGAQAQATQQAQAAERKLSTRKLEAVLNKFDSKLNSIDSRLSEQDSQIKLLSKAITSGNVKEEEETAPEKEPETSHE